MELWVQLLTRDLSLLYTVSFHTHPPLPNKCYVHVLWEWLWLTVRGCNYNWNIPAWKKRRNASLMLMLWNPDLKAIALFVNAMWCECGIALIITWLPLAMLRVSLTTMHFTLTYACLISFYCDLIHCDTPCVRKSKIRAVSVVVLLTDTWAECPGFSVWVTVSLTSWQPCSWCPECTRRCTGCCLRKPNRMTAVLLYVLG